MDEDTIVQVLAKDEGDFYFITTLTRRDVAHRKAGDGLSVPFDPDRHRAYGSLEEARALAAEHDAELVIS